MMSRSCWPRRSSSVTMVEIGSAKTGSRYYNYCQLYQATSQCVNPAHPLLGVCMHLSSWHVVALRRLPLCACAACQSCTAMTNLTKTCAMRGGLMHAHAPVLLHDRCTKACLQCTHETSSKQQACSMRLWPHSARE
jgi:hypothetical protein